MSARRRRSLDDAEGEYEEEDEEEHHRQHHHHRQSFDLDEQDLSQELTGGRFFERAFSSLAPSGDGPAARSNANRLLEALEVLSQDAANGGEGGDDIPHTLRGLLGQLHSVGGDGAMLNGLFPLAQLFEGATGSPRFHRILDSIKLQAPPHVQMSGLSELCETLSLSTEEVLVVSGFSVDAFVAAIAALIRTPPTMDVLLLAARALSSILELFPANATPKAIAEGVVPSLCAKLLEIEYMDVAELALQILERLVNGENGLTPTERDLLSSSSSSTATTAQIHADARLAILQENGIVAILQFVDFFPLEIQRTAARIVAQVCTNYPLSMAAKLQNALPLIIALLHSFDGEILQSGYECLCKLSESRAFSENASFAARIATDSTCDLVLQKLADYGRQGNAATGSNAQVPSSAYANMLRFLSCVLSLPVGTRHGRTAVSFLVERLRFVGLPPIVTMLLAKHEVIRDKQFLRETLKMIIVLLPITEELASMENIPLPMLTFAHELLPLIICVYDTTSRSDLRYDCLGVISRSCSIIYSKQQHPFTTDEYKELSRLAAFLSRVLRPKQVSHSNARAKGDRREEDLFSVHLALQIVEVSLLYAGSRNVAQNLFERHDVASAIRFYASYFNQNNESTVPSDDINFETDNYDVCAMSARLVTDYLGVKRTETSVVKQLQGIAKELQQLIDEDAHLQTESIQHVLEKLGTLNGVGDSEIMTAHEIACSGLVKILLRICVLSEGRRAFTQALLSRRNGSDQTTSIGSILVHCLQDAISSEKDTFSIENGLPSLPIAWFESGGVANDLDQLTQHIKIRVLIEDCTSSSVSEGKSSTQHVSSREQRIHEDGYEKREEAGILQKHLLRRSDGRESSSYHRRNRRGVHDTVVLVEPLARIETMEEFIADKLFGGKSTSSLIDDLAEAGRTENEYERKRGDNETGENEKKLRASYKGHLLPADSSILEAIVKFGAEDEDNSEKMNDEGASSFPSTLGAVNGIWRSTPHEITFRIVTSKVTATSPSLDTNEVIGNVAQNDTLKILEDKTVSRSEQWWDDVWDLLRLLKYVHKFLVSGSQAQHGFHQTINFVNNFLCLQINRALQQPIKVVANCLPEWCFRIVNEFPFVLDFDTRYNFVYATMCGTPRAIQYLCGSVWKKAVLEENTVLPGPSSARQNNSRRRSRDVGSNRSRTSALVNISRMVKLPRLKVRVSRSRLLQSAMKLFAIYGGKKAVIEIEFLGEVGTGLGPTTEFFTLICEEIQSKKLKMWRDEGRDVTGNLKDEEKHISTSENGKVSSSLPIRGYHRVAIYHCIGCKRVRIPHCSVHRQLLTHEKKSIRVEKSAAVNTTQTTENTENQVNHTTRSCKAMESIPQCAECMDDCDLFSSYTMCDCGHTNGKPDSTASNNLRWWIVSDEEIQYLAKVFPRRSVSVKHPVLQCAHCDTVNFPGTDAGIVEVDGDRMISRSGRRMYERDYRAVTKHVSPLCEGTPLTQITSILTRELVDLFVDMLPRSPEVPESEVEALNYLSESSSIFGSSIGGPPVEAPFGLYPKPYVPTDKTLMTSSVKAEVVLSETSINDMDVLGWFNFLGRFIGQALLDERLLNLPFSRPFLRALRGEKMVGPDVDVARSLDIVEEFDPAIANSLRYLNELAKKYLNADATATSPEDVQAWEEEVNAMCLYFTLVGDSDIELLPDGSSVQVTLDSLSSYVTKNLELLLDTSIASQVEAFQQGFEKIIGTSCHEQAKHKKQHFLHVFELNELERLFSDHSLGSSMWDREGQELREHMVCDHGYTAESKAIADLIAILCELTLEEQRLFVRFVTGASRLPLGGLAKLDPKLTVVRKLTDTSSASSTEEGDAVLPSASTCTNYLKLPDYSTRAIMKERLLYCMHEGQGSFHLS